MNLKKLSLILFVLILILIVGWFYKAYKTPPKLLPFENNLIDDSGNTVNVLDSRGRYLLVSYFQTWCGNCVHELLSIDALQMKVGKDKLKVMMVSDEEMKKILHFKEKYCNTLDYYQSKQPLIDLNIRVFPTTYLLDKKGNVILSKINEFDWSSEEVLKLIRE
jgi:cytochrome c biogenesis protein CcmG, thiol:disulfide interchange protein DsbE